MQLGGEPGKYGQTFFMWGQTLVSADVSLRTTKPPRQAKKPTPRVSFLSANLVLPFNFRPHSTLLAAPHVRRLFGLFLRRRRKTLAWAEFPKA
jgi:hypothetical protein